MKIRQKSFGLDTQPKVKKLNVAFLVKLCAAAAAVIAGIGLINYAIEVRNIRTSYLAGKESVVVGVRTDVPGFGRYDEDGNIQGFDHDVTGALIGRIFGEDILVEYVPLWSENAGAYLKYDKIDIAAGLIVADTDKTDGFVWTEPYYDDRAVIVTPGGTAVTSAELSGKNIGILNSMINVATMQNYLESTGAEAESIVRYYDFDSAGVDLEKGNIDVFIIPEKLAEVYFSEGFTIGGEELFGVSYSLLLPSGQSGIADVFSKEIDTMKSNGELVAFMKQWGLSD